MTATATNARKNMSRLTGDIADSAHPVTARRSTQRGWSTVRWLRCERRTEFSLCPSVPADGENQADSAKAAQCVPPRAARAGLA